MFALPRGRLCRCGTRPSEGGGKSLWAVTWSGRGSRLRDECLNEWLFTNYRHARASIEEWRIDYNLNRPHTSLDGLTQHEFATRSSRRDHNVNRANL